MNSIVLDLDFASDPGFRSLLRQVRDDVLSAFEHQEYPFGLLVERLEPTRHPGRTPIFQVSYVHQNLPSFGRFGQLLLGTMESGESLDLGGLDAVPYLLPQQEGQFDLELEVFEVGGSLVAVLQYATDLFETATIERMAGQFQTLIRSLLVQPEARVSELELMSTAEKQRQAMIQEERRVSRIRRLKTGRRRAVEMVEWA